MERLKRLFRETFPDLPRHAGWLAVMAMTLLAFYITVGSKKNAADWWLKGLAAFTGLEQERMFRYWWKDTACFVLLMVVPLILMRLFAGWKPQDLGLRLKGTGREFLLVIGLWLAFLPILWFVSDLPDFQKTYPQVRAVQGDAGLFLAHHGYYLVYWIAWEFFYRGLLLFGFERDMGAKAVLISTFPFVIMHYAKPPMEMVAAVAAGFILCGIALRSRSIFPGVLLHWLAQVSMDFANSHWWR